MRKIFMTLAIASLTVAANAQGKFEVKDFGSFKLHTHITADPLGDMSSIIEGQSGLVIVEPAAFRNNIEEQKEYIAKLSKPVERIIVNYHTAGLAAFEPEKYVIIEGMPEFVKGEIYSGMMTGFGQAFGDAIATDGELPSATVPRVGTEEIAGVKFEFMKGSESDFPGSSILIGGKVYYMHFAPVNGVHLSFLEIGSRFAVESYLSELQEAKASGADTFIGGHGAGATGIDAVDFQIGYLKTVLKVLDEKKSAEEFVTAMKAAYPNAAAEENLAAVAEKLYQ